MEIVIVQSIEGAEIGGQSSGHKEGGLEVFWASSQSASHHLVPIDAI